jgi:hypothetical protein
VVAYFAEGAGTYTRPLFVSRWEWKKEIATLTGITLNTDTVQKSYAPNEPLNLDGLVVTASYSDNTSEPVTGYTANPVAFTAAGFQPVTITYTENGVTRTAAFTVSVHAPGAASTGIAELEAWLDAQPNNTPATAYTVSLNVSDLGSGTDSLGAMLRKYNVSGTAANKYVNIDLSGSTITAIPDQAFCSQDYTGTLALTGIIIPNGVTTIGDGAFIGCTSLTSVTMPNSVTSIGEEAFVECSLTSITIPNSVTSIGKWAFEDCTSLTAINVNSDNTAYSSQDGVLYNKNKTAIIQYPKGKTGAYTIPNSVTSIGERAFRDCTSLTSVTIGSGVTSIGRGAFWECTGLTSVTIGSGVTSIGEEAFWECTGLTSVTIGSGVTSIGESAFWFCTSLTSVTIPATVTSIGKNAFRETGLFSVTFATGSNITSANFDDYAFPVDSTVWGEITSSLKTEYLAASPKAGTYKKLPRIDGFFWIRQTALTLNTWATWTNDRTLCFTFTATAATQYIHVDLGTSTEVYVSVYNSSGVLVGNNDTTFSSSGYTTRSLTAGQEYTIRVWNYTEGTCRIAFNTSSAAPAK